MKSTQSPTSTEGWKEPSAIAIAIGVLALLLPREFVLHGWSGLVGSLVFDVVLAVAIGGIAWLRILLARRIPAPEGYEPWGIRRPLVYGAFGAGVGGLGMVLVLFFYPGVRAAPGVIGVAGGAMFVLGALTMAVLLHRWGWRAVLRDLLLDAEPPPHRPLKRERPILQIGCIVLGVVVVAVGAWMMMNRSETEEALPRTLLACGPVLIGAGTYAWFKARGHSSDHPGKMTSQ